MFQMLQHIFSDVKPEIYHNLIGLTSEKWYRVQVLVNISICFFLPNGKNSQGGNAIEILVLTENHFNRQNHL